MKKTKEKKIASTQKQKKPKNPVINWMCFKCHHHKSTKTSGHVINSISLKCSLCDEHLEYNPNAFSDNYNRKDGFASCPICSNGIKVPLCNDCGEPLDQLNTDLDEFKVNNPIHNDEPIEIIKKKKSWWNAS
jgi:hypothetical protein